MIKLRLESSFQTKIAQDMRRRHGIWCMFCKLTLCKQANSRSLGIHLIPDSPRKHRPKRPEGARCQRLSTVKTFVTTVATESLELRFVVSGRLHCDVTKPLFHHLMFTAESVKECHCVGRFSFASQILPTKDTACPKHFFLVSHLTEVTLLNRPYLHNDYSNKLSYLHEQYHVWSNM